MRHAKADLKNWNLVEPSHFNLELMKIDQDEVPVELIKAHGKDLFPE